MDDRTTTMSDFLTASGLAGAKVTPLAGDASDRRYFRIDPADAAPLILMDAPGSARALAMFLRVAGYLDDLSLSAPQVIACDLVDGFLLLEDFGDAQFARLAAQDPAQEPRLYFRALDALTVLAKSDILPGLDHWTGADMARMTEPAFTWYAADDGARFSAISPVLEPVFDQLTQINPVVALRDFHAENLMWLDDRSGPASVGLLDFQDAVLAHPAYDFVSLTRDARRDIDPALVSDLTRAFAQRLGIPPPAFAAAAARISVQRNLRILGVFARLARRDGKTRYLSMIPRVWGHLQADLAHPDLANVRAVLAPALPEPTPAYLASLAANG